MEITLEKIELVKERAGVSYKEAKEALEAADGSVIDAIIDLEEKKEEEQEKAGATDARVDAIISAIKSTIKKGNMSRIIIKKRGEVFLNLPLTLGILGTVVAPWGAILSVIAAIGFDCDVEFINDKGETTDINGKVKTQYSRAKEAGNETIQKVRESDLYNDLYDKGQAAFEKGKETFDDLKERSQSIDIDDLKEKGQDVFDNLKSRIRKNDKDDDFFTDFEEFEYEDVDDIDDLIQEEEETVKDSSEAEKDQ